MEIRSTIARLFQELGGAMLSLGAIADGKALVRSGNQIVGADLQAQDATLTALADLVSSNNCIIYGTGVDGFAILPAPASGQRVGKALGFSSDTVLAWVALALALKTDVTASAVDVDTGGNSSYGVTVLNIGPVSNAGSDV